MPLTIKTESMRYRNPDGTYTEFDALAGSGSGSITVDSALSTLSENPIQNKVVAGAINALQSGKQSTLTFDSTPTAGSSNPVTSDGIKTALDTKQNTLTIDPVPTDNSTNPVASGGVKSELDDLKSSIPDGEINAKSFDVKIERFENIGYDEKLVPDVTLVNTTGSTAALVLEIDRVIRFQRNPYSVHFKTNPTGTSTDVRITVPTAFTLLGTQEFEVAFYAASVTGITNITLRTLASGFVKSLSQLGTTIEPGWNKLRFTSVGAGTWNESTETVTLRLVVAHDAGTDLDIYIGSITQIRPDKGNLILIEDAGYYSFLTDAYPDLVELGVPVTWGINWNLDAAGANPRNLINQTELDTLRMDGLSEFSFRATDFITENEQIALSAEEALADTLKCIRKLQENDIEPQRIFRAVWPFNKCTHPELANLEMDASASYEGKATVAAYPWIDRYNIPRFALGNQTTDWIDDRFDVLRKQHCTMLIYLHGIGTGSGQTSAELWTYFVGKLEAALEAGWLNATTYNRLVSHYAPISTAGVDMTAAVSASKSAADAAASAATAQSVAESIPADYTALSAQVAEIDGRVDDLESTAPLIVPTYDASVVYDSNALVLRGGKLYKHKVWAAAPAAENWTAGHWNQIASLAGELSGKINTELIALPYSPTSTYSAGDIIVRSDKLYRAKTAVAAENWMAGHWTLLGTIADVIDDVDDLKSSITQDVTVTGTTPTITALDNHRYKCGEVSTLTITLPESGIVDVIFTSGTTPTVLTVTPPTGVTLRWANGFEPGNLEADTVYEINIADGLGVAAAWTV